jgi:DNA-binding CsgD family transcriptional regulator
MAEVRSGRSATVVVHGSVGGGKTAMLDLLDREARSQGTVVLRARCSTVERAFPFGVVRQLLAPALDRCDPAEAAEVGTVLAGLPFTAGGSAADAAAFERLEALSATVRRMARTRPVVISVDDVQWADEPSARWLGFLVRRLERVPILVAVTSRGPVPGYEGDPAEEFTLHPTARLLRVGPLTAAGTEQVLTHALGIRPQEAFGRTCHAMSGGNPMLLTALLRELVRTDVPPIEAGSARLTAIGARVLPEAVRSSLRRESADVLRVACLLGVLGADSEAGLVQVVSGLESAAVTHAVKALEESGLLERGSPPRFCHPLIEQGLAGLATPAEQARAHDRAASALSDGRASAERIAGHLVASGSTLEPWGLEVLRRAARSAAERGAVTTAVRYLRRALGQAADPLMRRHLLVELGSAEVYTDVAACIRHLEEAEGLVSDPAERAEFVPALAQALLQSGQSDRATELLDRAAAELPDSDPQLPRVLGRRAVITAGGHSNDSAALTGLGPFREGAEWSGQEHGLLAALALRSSLLLDGADRAAALAERALDGFELGEDWELTSVHAIAALLHADRLEAVRRWYDESGAGDLLTQPAGLHAVLLAMRAKACHRTGDLVQARQVAELALGHPDQPHPHRPYAAAVAVHVLLDSGDIGDAQAIVARFGDAPEPENWPWPYLLEARARLLLSQGQPQTALRDLRACGRLQETRWGDNPGRLAWRSAAALVEHRLERGQAAREYAAEELLQARTWGAPVALARALRVSAKVGPRPQAQAQLEESVELLRHGQDPLELARSQIALGELLAGTKRREEAREQLRRAVALAQAASATALACEAHEALRAAGARPRRLSLVGPDSLTSSQLRIAVLAAEGLGNEEIATQLYVTKRTVEFHLTHVYRKLRVAGRGGLGAALAGVEHPARARA